MGRFKAVLLRALGALMVAIVAMYVAVVVIKLNDHEDRLLKCYEKSEYRIKMSSGRYHNINDYHRDGDFIVAYGGCLESPVKFNILHVVKIENNPNKIHRK